MTKYGIDVLRVTARPAVSLGVCGAYGIIEVHVTIVSHRHWFDCLSALARASPCTRR